MKIKITGLGILFLCLVFTAEIYSQVNDQSTSDWKEQMKEVMILAASHTDSAEVLARNLMEVSPYDKSNSEAHYESVMAEVHYYRQDYEQSMQSYRKALQLFLSVGDLSRLAVLYNNIGLLSFYKANYDSALVAYKASLELELRDNNKEGIAQSYQNLGLIYGKWERYEQVMEYYGMALNLYKELGNSSAIADMHNNMAVIAVRQEDHSTAMLHYKKAYEVYKTEGNDVGIATVSSNLGNLFNKQGHYSRANIYFQRALDAFIKLDDKKSLVHTYSMMANMYLNQDQMDKAVKHFELAEECNASIGLKDVKADNLKDLYKAYFEMGNYKQANVILEQYYTLRDSIFDDQKYERLIELEKKYHAEKSQKELTLLKSKEQKQQFILWGMSAFFLLCALMTFIWLYVMKIKERQKYAIMEHKVLRTQMNPHFIFNSLSALQCIIMENNQEEAIDFLSEFSTLMRQVLYYASEEQISLNKEREILEQYLRIQSKRFDPKINYHIEFDPLLNGDKVAVPPMLTQPFIENALEHGELNKYGNGTIDVRLRHIDQQLEIVVEDNGVGINKAASSKMGRKHKSVAMKRTRERLALINGDHKKQAVSLKITDLSSEGKHGTRVVFHIPYMEMN
jgi:tetratricopeptide (TPR) repeat protein